jgi:hypothetical protein
VVVTPDVTGPARLPALRLIVPGVPLPGVIASARASLAAPDFSVRSRESIIIAIYVTDLSERTS